MNLILYLDDNSIESPYLSKSFKDEIIFEWYIKLNSFLKEDEVKIITPNMLGEITTGEKKPVNEEDKTKILDKIAKTLSGQVGLDDFNKIFDEYLITSNKVEDREREPQKLKEVLKKIELYLTDKSDELPLVHSVYSTVQLDIEIDSVIMEGVRAHLEGDLFYQENYRQIRNKIQVKSYYDDFGKIDFYVEANPKITINGKTYYTQSISKAEYFKDEFKKCYDFLDIAIAKGKKVLWEFG